MEKKSAIKVPKQSKNSKKVKADLNLCDPPYIDIKSWYNIDNWTTFYYLIKKDNISIYFP